MAIKLKHKSYGPLTLKQGEDAKFMYTTQEGHKGRAALGEHADHHAPSDLILAALGSCVGISLQMAAKQMKLDAGPIEVEVTAEKAKDLPGRFARFVVRLALPDVADKETAQTLITNAKTMCTVSNTLNAEVVMELVDTLPA